MLIYLVGMAIVGGLTLSPHLGFAQGNHSSKHPAEVETDSTEMTLVGVALARDVKDREPVATVNPAISCETTDSSPEALPVVDSTTNGRVFFWNTVQSNGDSTLRHIWKMKRNQHWEPMAEIDLRIAQSQSYRTWSSKKFDRKHHLGEWRIEVANADQPDLVICHSSFRVK